MDELISRQAAINALVKLHAETGVKTAQAIRIVREQQAVQKWIPVKTRPMTEEEREYYTDHYAWEIPDEEAVIFECKMPDDGQEIWICTKGGHVFADVCEIYEGIGLEENGDWLDVIAWMPRIKPEPYREEDNR